MDEGECSGDLIVGDAVEVVGCLAVDVVKNKFQICDE